MSIRVSTSPDNFWPRCESAVALDPMLETAIAALLAGMTLEEKIGQMMQGDIRYTAPEDVRRYHLGAILNGGGAYPDNHRAATAADWLALADAYYAASMDTSDGGVAIPILWGTDAIHGHNNVMGATLFPHNIGLGATRNPELVEAIGKATAREVVATGIDWTFSPTLAVVRDDRWGRTYESYSEDPEIVKEYAAPMVCGLQGTPGTRELFDADHIIATAKHFIGDGGTERGIDQGNNVASEAELRDVHGQGYVTALEAGVQSVMASFNSWQGSRIHGHRYLLTDVLKAQMGFDGILVTDWNGFRYVDDCDYESCSSAINAGVDMVMVPEDFPTLIANTLQQVRAGEISMQRIDDAVTRILRVKMRAGLFEKGQPSTRPAAQDTSAIGAPHHRAIARQAVRESLVLLKNENNLLPLKPAIHVLVVGDGADNIGKQSGGWSITWQGSETSNADFPGATSIFTGIAEAVRKAGGKAVLSEDGVVEQRPDVAVVVFGEEPYAEGQGDRKALSYSATRPQDLKLLRSLKQQGIPVVAVFLTGRPLWINPELNASDAFVVAWLPGSEGGGIADLLFQDPTGNSQHDFRGRLSFSWPADALQSSVNRHDDNYAPLFPFGYGLSLLETTSIGDSLPEDDSAADIEDSGSGLLRLFDGRPIPPFALFIGDPANSQVPVMGSFAISAGKAISVTSTDRQVQEDARRIIWHGTHAAQAYLRSDQPLDMSELAAAGGAIVFEARVHARPASTVGMQIAVRSGVMTFDATSVLEQLPLDRWQTVSIGLEEFDGAEDWSSVTAPFLISSAGALELSVADIRVVAPEDSTGAEPTED